jgi:hypothetical protein
MPDLALKILQLIRNLERSRVQFYSCGCVPFEKRDNGEFTANSFNPELIVKRLGSLESFSPNAPGGHKVFTAEILQEIRRMVNG